MTKSSKDYEGESLPESALPPAAPITPVPFDSTEITFQIRHPTNPIMYLFNIVKE